MVAFTRLGLFGFVYFTIFFISATVEKNIERNFQGFSFLVISLALLCWIYLNHQDNSPPRELNEMLYVITFLCAFTSLGSFLGLC